MKKCLIYVVGIEVLIFCVKITCLDAMLKKDMYRGPQKSLQSQSIKETMGNHDK